MLNRLVDFAMCFSGFNPAQGAYATTEQQRIANILIEASHQAESALTNFLFIGELIGVGLFFTPFKTYALALTVFSGILDVAMLLTRDGFPISSDRQSAQTSIAEANLSSQATEGRNVQAEQFIQIHVSGLTARFFAATEHKAQPHEQHESKRSPTLSKK